MSDYEPLLVRFPESGDSFNDGERPGWVTAYRRARRVTRHFLSSRAKHYAILSFVVLDVAGIMSGIAIALVTCELHRQDEKWVEPTTTGLSMFSLAMSCIFLLELLLSLWVEGLWYLANWLQMFDAFVIVVSFIVDLIEHGMVEKIASLIIILRLWRFVKIVDEFSVEASKQTEDLQRRLEELEAENARLRENHQQCELRGDEPAVP